jgi:hypothetical protein
LGQESTFASSGFGGYDPGMTDTASPAPTDTPPDRLCVDPSSPYHNAELLQRGIGIRFKGVEKTNVEEYCVSEGWVRLAVGKTLDRNGKQMTVKLQGTVEPYFES